MVAGTVLIAAVRHIPVVYSAFVSLCQPGVSCVLVFLKLETRIFPCKSPFSSFPSHIDTEFSNHSSQINPGALQRALDQRDQEPLGSLFHTADEHRKGQSIGPIDSRELETGGNYSAHTFAHLSPVTLHYCCYSGPRLQRLTTQTTFTDRLVIQPVDNKGTPVFIYSMCLTRKHFLPEGGDFHKQSVAV